MGVSIVIRLAVYNSKLITFVTKLENDVTLKLILGKRTFREYYSRAIFV